MKFLKPAALLLSLGPVAFSANAHDFWIEPLAYALDEGGDLGIEFFVGHGEDKSDWPIAPHRLVGFRSIGPDGLTSHVSGAENADADIVISLPKPGLHMIFVETTNAYSELAAEKFNAYVEEEGVLPVMTDRIERRLTDTPGRELYSRRGKALVQTACPQSVQPVWSTPLGLTLEILSDSNPFDWDESEPFSVEVRFHGAAVPSAMLHVTNLDDETDVFTKKTGADGRVDLGEELSEGRWLIHTVWSEAADGLLAGATYQTYFSSFTFQTHSDCAADQ